MSARERLIEEVIEVTDGLKDMITVQALRRVLTPERIAELYAEMGGEQDEDTPAGQVGDSGSSPEPVAPPCKCGVPWRMHGWDGRCLVEQVSCPGYEPDEGSE